MIGRLSSLHAKPRACYVVYRIEYLATRRPGVCALPTVLPSMFCITRTMEEPPQLAPQLDMNATRLCHPHCKDSNGAAVEHSELHLAGVQGDEHEDICIAIMFS